MTRLWSSLASAGLMLVLAGGGLDGHAQAVDLLIRNARVIDGTGSPWFVSDVVVDYGRIVALGSNLDVEASQTIDAAGRILAPGFIDVHTHAESGLDRLPRADNFLLDGVTTVVGGNCGGSETDIGEWSRGLTGLGINVATLVGHNSIRRAIMGLDDRAPTERELEQMRAMVEKAMRDGALGFSTGLAATLTGALGFSTGGGFAAVVTGFFGSGTTAFCGRFLMEIGASSSAGGFGPFLVSAGRTSLSQGARGLGLSVGCIISGVLGTLLD